MEQKSSTRGKQRRDPAVMRTRDWVLMAAGLAVVVGLIAFVLMRSSPPVADVPPATAAMPAAEPATAGHDHAAESSVRRMTVAELRTALDRGEAVVVDVRDVDSYRSGHIPRSMHIPLNFVESQVPYLPKGKTFVSYCT